ncbi:hypothetical protein Tco_1040024, partial [Tanacetum coccineum]
MENANPSSPTPSCEFLDPKKKLEVENSKNVDLLADSDSEFEEEIEEGVEGEWLDIEEPLDLANIDPDLSHIVFGRPFIEEACLAINRKHGLMTFTDGIREVTFKTPYKDPERSELTSEGHDLLSSRVILSEDDYDCGCRKPSDLENEFYRGTIKLGPEYLTELDESSSSGRDENQGGVT